jgi:hypothetical protein
MRVLDLPTLIEVKRRAGRPKDLAALPFWKRLWMSWVARTDEFWRSPLPLLVFRYSAQLLCKPRRHKLDCLHKLEAAVGTQ